MKFDRWKENNVYWIGIKPKKCLFGPRSSIFDPQGTQPGRLRYEGSSNCHPERGSAATESKDLRKRGDRYVFAPAQIPRRCAPQDDRALSSSPRVPGRVRVFVLCSVFFAPPWRGALP